MSVCRKLQLWTFNKLKKSINWHNAIYIRRTKTDRDIVAGKGGIPPYINTTVALNKSIQLILRF